MMGESRVRVAGVTRAASQTALTAAAARAAHLIVDGQPTIFADPLAAQLLGDEADELLSYHRNHGTHVVLTGARTQVVCRSRYTEDRLADAVGRGIRQYVILGAGLDTFAYRSPLAQHVRTYEVDHPASQADKRIRVDAAALSGPVSYVEVDFESGDLGAALSNALGPGPAFVSWLGVTMYLTADAIAATAAILGALGPGSELVFDYMVPASLRDEAGQSYVDQVAPVSELRGEPWRSFFDPRAMSDLLRRAGFGVVDHTCQRDAVPAAMWDRTDALRPARLSTIAHARVT
jgi:methyltransferase (TIGR00027 family)